MSQQSITKLCGARFRRNQEQLTPDLAGPETKLMIDIQTKKKKT